MLRRLSDPAPAATKRVAAALLHVSEPAPGAFGNAANATGDARWTNANWLKSRFHFAFAEYGGAGSGAPERFGVVRVVNDDLVQAGRGFGQHPHRDMEIVTYVVDGELTHQDSMGSRETLPAGSVQFMTAGTGVVHAEANASAVGAPLRFVQIWIEPRRRGLPPAYGSVLGAPLIADYWAHLVSDADRPDIDTPIKIHQDANVFVAELNGDGAPIVRDLGADRQLYLICLQGRLAINAGDVELVQYDACEVKGPGRLTLATLDASARAIAIEMAKTADSRF